MVARGCRWPLKQDLVGKLDSHERSLKDTLENRSRFLNTNPIPIKGPLCVRERRGGGGFIGSRGKGERKFPIFAQPKLSNTPIIIALSELVITRGEEEEVLLTAYNK